MMLNPGKSEVCILAEGRVYVSRKIWKGALED